tara:strand:- start:922 stop:1161 length:240 start_codon:yes stop_codon:yes gene_type:complete
MLDFVWRILGFSLDKDIVRAHQLARARKYFEGEEVKKAKALIDEAEASSPLPFPSVSAKKAHTEANEVIAKRTRSSTQV